MWKQIVNKCINIEVKHVGSNPGKYLGFDYFRLWSDYAAFVRIAGWIKHPYPILGRSGNLNLVGLNPG